ncbi:hypothetical protein GPALN_010336 [Globodera pallida]|nr:hypothetical protein GPALN_010336 [Globodera pallida]
MTQKTFDATSWWWYFAKIDENRVKCKICEWERDYDSKRGTNSLKFHLEKEHPDKFKEKNEAKQKKEEAEKTRKRAREQQPSLLQHGFSSSCPTDQPSSNKRRADSPASNYAIFKNWSTGSENEQNLERKIGEFIALDCQPFSVVEDEDLATTTREMKFFEPYLTDSHRKIFEQAAAEMVTPILESSEDADPQESPVHLGGIFALMEAQQNEDMTFIQPNLDLSRTTSPNWTHAHSQLFKSPSTLPSSLSHSARTHSFIGKQRNPKENGLFSVVSRANL